MMFLALLSSLPAILCMDAITRDLVTPSKLLGEACGYDGCKEIRENTLNVHLVPHTHGELGFTSEFYIHYTGNFAPDQPKSQVNMKRILDYTITELWADTERKFTLSDMAYFFYWWSQRDPTVHRMVYELVRQGRLHFVGGGFSMADEATTSYHAVIDMLTYSLRKLNSTFLDCGRPLVSWQTDVFGHSREFASLMAQMGFNGHFINPISYDDEVARMVMKSLEFLWRGSDDLGANTDIFTHKLFDGYWSPPGFCFGTFCDDPLLVESDTMFNNIEKRVEAFIDSALHRQGPYYTTRNIMVIMGQRFGYFDAGVWFANMDRLIFNVNKKSVATGFPVHVFYSAPACYLRAVMETNPGLTVKQDDFLPFAYDQTSMAVGFYTSRPTLKYQAREGHVFMQIAKQLQVTARVIYGFDSVMDRLMWVNSVFQDHNILTGVVTEFGRRYYVHKMYTALQGCTRLINKAFNKIRHSPEDTRYHRCAFNISLCQNTDAQQYFIVIYNPLAWNVTVNVRLPSLNQPFVVYHPSGLRVKAGIMKIPEPVFKIYRHKTYATHELIFIAEDIPPLGFRSYFIRLKNYGWSRPKRSMKRAIVKKVNQHKTKKYLIRQSFPNPNTASEEKDDISFDYEYFEGKPTTPPPKTKILFGSVESDRETEQNDERDEVITPRTRSEEQSQRRTDLNDPYVETEMRPVKNDFDIMKQEERQEFSAEITVNETSDSDSNIAVFNDSDFIETTTFRVSSTYEPTTFYETTTTYEPSTTTYEPTTLKFSNDDKTKYTYEPTSVQFSKDDETKYTIESKYSNEDNKELADAKDSIGDKIKENEIESSNTGIEELKSENRTENVEESEKFINDVVTTTAVKVESTTKPSSVEEELYQIQVKQKGKDYGGRKFGVYESDDEFKMEIPKDKEPIGDKERERYIDKIWDGYGYYSPTENTISNKYIKINLDSKRKLSSISLSNGVNITFTADMYFYASDDPKKFEKNVRPPGISMFRVMDPRPELIQDYMNVHIYRNRIVQEIHYQFSDYASFAIRLYSRDPVIELEWLVGPVPIGDDIGKDIFIRYTTNLVHNGVFYTDSNGRQTIKRVRHMRATYEPMSPDYLGGNIYPVTSRIYIEDEDMNVRFSVFNDRAQGATSLADGEIDMFLHRRILTDDTSRGVLTLNETEYGQGIRVRGKHFLYITKANTKINKVFEKKLAKEKELTPQILVTKNGPYGIDSKKTWMQQINEFSALKTKLPVGVHILTLEKWGEKGEDLLLRLENYLEKSDAVKSGIKKVVLQDMFVSIRIKDVFELTLGANMRVEDHKVWPWKKKQKFLRNFNEAYGSRERIFAEDSDEKLERISEEAITLAPQQIRTFFITYDYIEKTFSYIPIVKPTT